MCSSRRPEFCRRCELSTSAGPSSQRAISGVRSLIEFEPPREQRTGFYLSPHFLVCAACAAASKARARHSAGRAGYVYCALSRCAMCACMRASRATARLVRRKSRERKGGPGRTVPPLFMLVQTYSKQGEPDRRSPPPGGDQRRVAVGVCLSWPVIEAGQRVTLCPSWRILAQGRGSRSRYSLTLHPLLSQVGAQPTGGRGCPGPSA